MLYDSVRFIGAISGNEELHSMQLLHPEFQFWLELFSKGVPYVDIMFFQFQSRNIDAAKASLKPLISSVQNLTSRVWLTDISVGT